MIYPCVLMFKNIWNPNCLFLNLFIFSADKKRYRKANEFVIVMGTLNRYQRVNGTIVSYVKSIAYMNTFTLDTMRDDIGLMFLKTGLPTNKTHLTIAPIALANTSTPAGVSCQISGWGKTERVRFSINKSILKRNCFSYYARKYWIFWSFR